ncbi:MAG TPA: hypothetical protein VFS43_07150 [Polyangiaceae bacterium]|nr:hypothetical protein [Polyangiaceae bacterium]
MLALAVALSVSFAALAAWTWRRGAFPSGGWAGGSSDHFSHYNSAIVLFHRGLDVWRKPLVDVCPPAPAAGVYGEFPAHDVCNLPERGESRPLVMNWRQFPRPYPPGWALWHAPAALLHEATSVGVYALNRLVVIQDLLAAHGALGLLALILFSRRPGEPPPDGATFLLRAFTLALAGGELLRWSMLGYYDVAAVALALLAVLRLRDGRDADAAAWLAAALFLHFRTLWLAPLFAWIARRLLLAGRGALAAGRGRLALAAALVALALGAFALVRPALADFPPTSPVFRFRFDPKNAEHWNLVVPLALAFWGLARARAFLVGAVAAFQLFVLTNTPQAQAWHSLFLLPVLALARTAPGARRGAELATCALFVVECRSIFGQAPLLGSWLASLFAPPAG